MQSSFDIKEVSQSLYDRFMKYFKLEEYRFYRTSGEINLSMYGVEKSLFHTKNLISLNQHGFALSELHDMIRYEVFDGNSIRLEKKILDSDEELQRAFEFLNLLRDTTFNFKYWLNSEYKQYLDNFIEWPFIKDEDLTVDKIKPIVFSIAYHHSFQYKSRIYQYQAGEDFSSISHLPWSCTPRS